MKSLIYTSIIDPPQPREGWNEYLGFLCLAGFGLFLFRTTKRLTNNGLREVFWSEYEKLIFYTLIIGVPYGLGTLFNYFVTPEIRCYNRISVFLACLLILYVLWEIQDKHSFTWYNLDRLKKISILTAVSLFLIFDLIPRNSPFSPQPSIVDQYRVYIERVSAILQASTGKTQLKAFQLPYQEMPEAPPIVKMGNYDQFLGYLLSEGNYWSFGVNKFRNDSLKIQQAAFLPLNYELIQSLGYNSIYIDTFGYADSGKNLIKEISLHTHQKPIIGPDGRIVMIILPDKL